MTLTLTPLDGHDVVRTTISVTNAGDGLSQAMKIDPQELHHGDTVYVLLECEVSKVRFDRIKDTDDLTRVHVLRAGNATLVDSEFARPLVAEMVERITLAREAEQGIGRLFQPTEEGYRIQHELGEHEDGPVDGCPDCDGDAAENDPLAEVIG